ncbi:hypothetical protein ACPW96_21715 [Micromonospora sp. DT81.3]
MALYASIRSNRLSQGEQAMDQEELDREYIESGEWAIEDQD